MDKALTMTSGPIPVGSPMVIPMRGRDEEIRGSGDGESFIQI
jgi:hypothetical protein